MSTTTKTVTTLEARGSGSLTAGHLADLLADWPEGAFIVGMQVGDNQYDGSWWSVKGQVTS